LCHLQHKLIGFYNRDEKCLQRGTNWVFKKSSLRFVFIGLYNINCFDGIMFYEILEVKKNSKILEKLRITFVTGKAKIFNRCERLLCVSFRTIEGIYLRKLLKDWGCVDITWYISNLLIK
jgi:hypothetical protein